MSGTIEPAMPRGRTGSDPARRGGDDGGAASSLPTNPTRWYEERWTVAFVWGTCIAFGYAAGSLLAGLASTL